MNMTHPFSGRQRLDKLDIVLAVLVGPPEAPSRLLRRAEILAGVCSVRADLIRLRLHSSLSHSDETNEYQSADSLLE
jgi:hypothetical protein